MPNEERIDRDNEILPHYTERHLQSMEKVQKLGAWVPHA